MAISIPEFIDLAVPFFKGEVVAKKDFTELQGKLDFANGELTKTRGDLTKACEELTASKNRIAELEASEKKLQGELATEKKNSEGTEAKIRTEGSKQAATVLAELAVKPLELKPAEGADGGRTLHQQYMEISDPKERARFWAKHGGLEGILGKSKK